MNNKYKWLKYIVRQRSTYWAIVSIVGFAYWLRVNLNNTYLSMQKELEIIGVFFTAFIAGGLAQLGLDLHDFRKQNRKKDKEE